ncbi:MAG: glycosyltransferase family 4 protein [Candidatus Njordarchaeales archaeon]
MNHFDKLRILILNKTDRGNPYWFGGAEVRLYNLVKYWRKMFSEITIISSRFPYGQAVEIIDNVQIFRYGYPMYRNILSPLFLDYGFLKHLLGKRKYNIIYFASTPYPPITVRILSLLKSFCKKWGFNTRVIAHIDHLPVREAYPSYTSYMLARIVDESLLSNADFDIITTVSIASMRDIKRLFPDTRIVVTGNGVDTNVFKPLGVPEEEGKIFSWGLMYHRKGFHLLIRAFRKVTKEYPNARLVLAGEGPEKIKLQRLSKKLGLSDKVTFLPKLSDDELVYEINTSQIVVIPSLWEGFGLTVLEAMACKKAVIAFNVPAINELITSNRNGLLVPEGDIDKLANSIVHLLNSDNLRKRIADNAYLFARKFSWENVAKREFMAMIS